MYSRRVSSVTYLNAHICTLFLTMHLKTVSVTEFVYNQHRVHVSLQELHRDLKLNSGVAFSPSCPSKLTSVPTQLCLELQDSIGSICLQLLQAVMF